MAASLDTLSLSRTRAHELREARGSLRRSRAPRPQRRAPSPLLPIRPPACAPAPPGAAPVAGASAPLAWPAPSRATLGATAAVASLPARRCLGLVGLPTQSVPIARAQEPDRRSAYPSARSPHAHEIVTPMLPPLWARLPTSVAGREALCIAVAQASLIGAPVDAEPDRVTKPQPQGGGHSPTYRAPSWPMRPRDRTAAV